MGLAHTLQLRKLSFPATGGRVIHDLWMLFSSCASLPPLQRRAPQKDLRKSSPDAPIGSAPPLPAPGRGLLPSLHSRFRDTRIQAANWLKREWRALHAPGAGDLRRKGACESAKLRPLPQGQLQLFRVRVPQRPHSPTARPQQQQAAIRKAQRSLDSSILLLGGPAPSERAHDCQS